PQNGIFGPTREDVAEEEPLHRELAGETPLQDDLRFYFERATTMDLLPREEEVALGCDIRAKRAAWRRSVLQSNFARHQALSLYADAERASARELMREIEMDEE